MIRFTETAKWSDKWFRRLSPMAKLLWGYITDNCDQAGVIDFDLELASMLIGRQGKEEVAEEHLKELGSRIQVIEGGKLLVCGFIHFQCRGEPSKNCNAHTQIFKAIDKYGLVSDGVRFFYSETGRMLDGSGMGPRMGQPPIDDPSATHRRPISNGSTTPPKKSEKKYHDNAKDVLAHLNLKADRQYRETDKNLELVSARLNEKDVDPAEVLIMIDRMCAKWKCDPKMSEYLQPTTLFGKEKFGGYYDNRYLPVASDDSTHTPRNVDHKQIQEGLTARRVTFGKEGE